MDKQLNDNFSAFTVLISGFFTVGLQDSLANFTQL